MMGLVRAGRGRARGSGFFVTWDVDSWDRSAANRLRYFVFGRRTRKGEQEYAYRGFVWKEGVRYLAQSAIFVLPRHLEEILGFLRRNGIDHEVEPAIFEWPVSHFDETIVCGFRL